MQTRNAEAGRFAMNRIGLVFRFIYLSRCSRRGKYSRLASRRGHGYLRTDILQRPALLIRSLINKARGASLVLMKRVRCGVLDTRNVLEVLASQNRMFSLFNILTLFSHVSTYTRLPIIQSKLVNQSLKSSLRLKHTIST